MKGPSTCVRSFLYYFEETRRGGGGGTEAFLSPPRLRDGVRPQPRPPGAGSLQLPYPGPRAGSTLCISIQTQIHPSMEIFRVSGKGTEQGGGIEQLMLGQRRHKMPAGPAGPQLFSNLRAIGCFGHPQALVWGSGCALVPAPLPALPPHASGPGARGGPRDTGPLGVQVCYALARHPSLQMKSQIAFID